MPVIERPRRCLIAATTSPANKRDPSANDSKTRQFAIDAARHAASTRCHNVVLLDVRGISPVTDYMLLATGTSARQMRTVCDELGELAAQRGEHPLGTDGIDTTEGSDGGGWMLIDFVNVVVHVFSQDARAFYDLDSLWGDAKHVEVLPQPLPQP